jgi:hypothetical protein
MNLSRRRFVGLTGLSPAARRWDGWSWAVLFNTQGKPAGRTLTADIEPRLYQALHR